MRTLFLLTLLCLSAALTAHAQAQPASLGVKPLDGLLAAINAKAVAPLEPYLGSATRVGSLPAAYTPQVLAQLLPQFGPVSNVRLVRQQQEGANVRYVCAMTRKETEKEYDFLVGPDGKFLELNLAQASVKKVGTVFGPDDLTLPPTLDVPVRLVKGLILVEAEVDGRRGTFVLDSGAPALMLNKREFAAGGAAAVAAPGGPQGVGGRVGGMSYYAVRQFDWQGLRFQGKEVPTLDLAAIEQEVGTTPLLGLIGYNLLSQYALTLDYRAARVELRREAVAGPAPLLKIPFTLRGHLPMVEVVIEGQPYQLALDCGAQTNLLDQQFAPAFTRKLRKKTKDTLRGADDQPRLVVSGQIAEMRLAGTLAFHNQRTVFTDISHLNQQAGRAAVQGIAGYPLLSQYRTTIDYVHQQLLVTNW